VKNKPAILIISIAILLLLNLGAGVLIKFSPNYYGDYILLGSLAVLLSGIYFCRALMWLFLGKRYQLSYVYPLLSVSYVLSFSVGMVVFHEPFVVRRLIGSLIILSGVSLLSLSRHRHEVRRKEGSV